MMDRDSTWESESFPAAALHLCRFLSFLSSFSLLSVLINPPPLNTALPRCLSQAPQAGGWGREEPPSPTEPHRRFTGGSHG